MKKTKEQISYNMRQIKNKDSKIEKVLRKALWERGYRYRKNYSKLPGKPDIVLTKYRIAVFCDSEYFYGKDFEKTKEQLATSSNPGFWIDKIQRNMERDEEVNRLLRSMDWTVLRFWGKDILKNTDQCVQAIEEAIWKNLELE